MKAIRSTAPRVRVRGLLVALSLGIALPQAASAARWLDSLPADDPDTVVRSNPTLGTPPAPAAAAGVLSSITGFLGAIATGTSQALWETAYMFGMNSTPVPRTAIVDPVLELTPLPEEPAVAIAPPEGHATPSVPSATAEP